MRFWRPNVRFDPWEPGRNANDKPISIVSFHPTSEIPCFYHVSHNSFIWKVAMNTGTVSDPAGCFCPGVWRWQKGDRSFHWTMAFCCIRTVFSSWTNFASGLYWDLWSLPNQQWMFHVSTMTFSKPPHFLKWRKRQNKKAKDSKQPTIPTTSKSNWNCVCCHFVAHKKLIHSIHGFPCNPFQVQLTSPSDGVSRPLKKAWMV